jgi:hypothetical protein
MNTSITVMPRFSQIKPLQKFASVQPLSLERDLVDRDTYKQ